MKAEVDGWRPGLNAARRLVEDRAREHLDAIVARGLHADPASLADAVVVCIRRIGGAGGDALWNDSSVEVEPLKGCMRVLNALSSLEDDATQSEWSNEEAEIGYRLVNLPHAPTGAADESEDEEESEDSIQAYALPRGLLGFNDTGTPSPIGSLVPSLIDLATLVITFGAPNAGKSFFVSDLAWHLATGTTWRGRVVRRVGVLYVCLETPAGLLGRLDAWKIAHPDIRSAALAICVDHFNLAVKEDADRLLSIARDTQRSLRLPLGLIVVDTLARSLEGMSENSDEVMGAVVGAAGRMQKETGAAVMLIHHPGRDASKGPRGHTCLPAAAETILEVTADAIGNRLATVWKQRDGKKGERFAFRLAPSGVSAIVLHENAPPPVAKRREPRVDLSALLIGAVIAAQASREPYCLTGKRSLHNRRAELPDDLRVMPRDRIIEMAQDAIASGAIVRNAKGALGIAQELGSDTIH